MTITATEFKAKCLGILDEVPPEGVAITKRGKIVARLMPEDRSMARFFGILPDIVVDPNDDLFSTGEKWDAES
ncbi:hypothetical protein BH11ARM2_BH11ARM2_31660 [soil metagenome]